MATTRQIDANRANAKLSTGPRSPDGKARASRNATTHGLLTTPNRIAGRDKARFNKLVRCYRAYYKPREPVEHDLVDQMILARWRLAIAQRLELGFWDLAFEADPKADENTAASRTLAAHLIEHCSAKQTFGTILRYDSAIRRSYDSAIKALMLIRTANLLNGYQTKPISKDRAPFRKSQNQLTHPLAAPARNLTPFEPDSARPVSTNSACKPLRAHSPAGNSAESNGEDPGLVA